MKLRRSMVISFLAAAFFSLPAAAQNTDAMEKHWGKDKDGKMMKMSPEMESMIKSSAESAKSLVTMGDKLIREGNASGDAEKMKAGVRMIHLGMGLSGHPMMHGGPHAGHGPMTGVPGHGGHGDPHKMHKDMEHRDHHEKMMMQSMGMSETEHEKMKQMLREDAAMLLNMGNKLVKDGSGTNNAKKMLDGAELANMGMMMHHMHMPMMRVEKKVIKTRDGKVIEEEVKVEKHHH